MVQVKLGAYRFQKESIVKLRQRLGMSQAAMAADLNIPKNTLSRWETGATVPDALQLAAIYSLGMKKGIAADFFVVAKKQPAQTAQAASRTTALVYWDMQNVAPSKRNAPRWERSAIAAIEKACPNAKPLLTFFCSPDQQQAASALTQKWRKQVCTEDCDERIVKHVRSDAGQSPAKTSVFLITRDRGYVNLIKEQRAKNVHVYVITPPNVSKKLVSAVGGEYLITLPQE